VFAPGERYAETTRSVIPSVGVIVDVLISLMNPYPNLGTRVEKRVDLSVSKTMTQ
jgi:hypothetical protein